ncbi:hypothetical protein SAMN06265222_101619 [Neorhodopirellula lusitana]|uniref:Uncharacterized protein n=1 Tax=Neorhodopirellula lusitana TaxID=445327 RepID=A0ABY1PQU8_9BACT|nr:hypothetical protein SAMN06265222_101619 [Neorhodopirellula lusitana]
MNWPCFGIRANEPVQNRVTRNSHSIVRLGEILRQGEREVRERLSQEHSTDEGEARGQVERSSGTGISRS